ncbi:MAG: GNAT family N-acetyltransferase [Acidimicrobiia bacterium]
MSVTTEPFDANTADESIIFGAHRASVDLERDFFPDDPEASLEYHRRAWEAPSGSHRDDHRFVAIDGDEAVGIVHVATWIDHRDSGLITPAVRRDRRRRGVGKALFLRGIDTLENEGRSKLIVDIPDGSFGESVAERIGLKRALREKINQLLVSEIDWELMESWIEATKSRSPEYRLEFWEPPFPEDRLDDWCRISDVMNTAPIDDFDLEETVMTPQKWRSIETNLGARGYVIRAALAVHQPSGRFAGMTTLMALRHHPEMAQQDDTVVDPDHRGNGLGRLLKASMARRFLAEFPGVTRINTGNAGSNAPMLKINEEMGFRTILEISAWQGDIESTRAALTAS